MTNQRNWYLYLIRDKRDALYCGITTDIQRRLIQHKEGKGAKALKGKMPLSLVFECLAGDRSTASKLEFSIKQLSKKGKERLVLDQPDDVIDYLSNQTASKCEE